MNTDEHRWLRPRGPVASLRPLRFRASRCRSSTAYRSGSWPRYDADGKQGAGGGGAERRMDHNALRDRIRELGGFRRLRSSSSRTPATSPPSTTVTCSTSAAARSSSGAAPTRAVRHRASPKFWVKWALDLDSGRPKLLKFPFQEAFSMRIGALRVPCFRDPEKEGRVLRLVRGDRRFMQGRTVTDDDGHAVTSWTSCRDRTCTTSSGRPHALTVSTSSASCRACCAACATRWTRWPG